jgi:cell division initiation protein
MRISPLEIEQQTFNKAMRGFDPVEVTTYLENLAREFESLIAENVELKEKVKLFSSKLEGYEEIEKTLHETLLTSQRTVEETKRNIEKEADLVIKQAHLERQRILEEARAQLSDLNRKVAELQMAKERYLVEFRAFLGAQWHLLETIDTGTDSAKPSHASSRRRSRLQGEELERALKDLEEQGPQSITRPTAGSGPAGRSAIPSPPAGTGGEDEQTHRKNQ